MKWSNLGVGVVEGGARGGGVTVCRDCSHTCVHLALLCICDACALYTTDWGAIMARKQITIYGNGCVLFVRYALCGRVIDTVCIVL
jgi:hypothetical protein